MRHVRRFSVPTRWRAGALPLCAAFVFGCHGEVGSTGTTSTIPPTPLCADSDPGNVVAPQRITLLTSTQLMNMVRLVSPAEAQAVLDGQVFDVLPDGLARFPPSRTEKYKNIPDPDTLTAFMTLAQHVGDYVTANFMAVTKCATPATDQCATTYLNGFAERAYRRGLTTDEQTRFTNLYNTLKSQIVNGYQVTLTVEQATGYAVNALFMSPQLLWRFELGSQVSSSPPGIYLTDGELAGNLAFFLTDAPPDDMILADAKAGTLRNNIASHVDRLIAIQGSRDWLRHVMQLYFFLNQLPTTQINADKLAPIMNGGALYADLQVESQKFLDDAMWSSTGKVMDLITSKKAFLNYSLATSIYNVPPPAGTSDQNLTTFVETQLPADQRSGMLTSAAFITTRSRPTGTGIVPRGLGVKALFTCLTTPGPPASGAVADQINMQKTMLDNLTAQEQVQYRKDNSPCNGCHPSFDPYGLVLEWYDVVGRFRQTDDLGKPVDGHTTLPASIGGQTVQSAIELADVLSSSDAFTNCMAKTLMQYGLIDYEVELPLPLSGVKGCAAAGVADKLRKSPKQSFTDLTRAVATSPAFVLRKQIQ